MLELMKMIWSKLLNSLKIENRGDISRKTVLIFVLLVVVGGILLYFSLSDKGVSLEIGLPEEPVLMGVPFELEVRLINNSQSKLNNARVALGLPKGLAFFEDSQKVNVVKGLEEVSPGGEAKTSFTLIALPSNETGAHEVLVSATYVSGSLSAEFTKKEERMVDVLERNIDFELDIPNTISVGREFQAVIKYKNLIDEAHMGRERPGLILLLEGSQDFSIVASEPASLDSDSGWIMKEGEDNQLSITGRVDNKSEDIFILKGKVMLEFGGEKYILKEKEAELTLAPSPLSFNLSLSDSGGSVLPGDLLTYNIHYRNDTGVDLKDVVIKAQLIGEMFDMETLKTEANFNEFSRTISWTSNKFNKLAQVKQGDEGVFSFNIRVEKSFPIGDIGNKNYTLKVKSIIESPTVTQGLSTDRTTGSDVEETKIASLVNIDAKAYFRDADSDILNRGPFPPKVNQATSYSIHLELSSYGNDLEDIIVRTRLENGVNLVNLKEGGTGSVPEYNESTREIVWRLDRVIASTGLLVNKSETIFQVEATPDISMAGQYVPLLGITTVSAKDTFTGADLAATDEALDTRLPDDKSVSSEEGRVIR
jgi:hypothetical protein